MTPLDVQDGSFSPDTTKDIPYELKSSKRKGGDTDEEIVISESTMNIIMDRSESALAFVSTRSNKDCRTTSKKVFREGRTEVSPIVKKLLIAPIKVYQKWISPMFGPRCKYYPSCSSYAVSAIEAYGVKGVAMSAWRLLRCNPWSHGGVDYAVPKEKVTVNG